MPKIKWLLKNNSPPQFLVIHFSGNDLGDAAKLLILTAARFIALELN
jgi:hypothetical protein